MARYYKSDLCQNCGRDKKLVDDSLGSTFMIRCPMWLNIKYCQECHMKRCQDPTSDVDYSETPPITYYGVCNERRAVVEQGVHPAVYRDYCEKHWQHYAFCHKRTCKKPKEVWRDFCDSCHERYEATRLRSLNRKRATAARLAKETEPKRWNPYKYVRKQLRLGKRRRKNDLFR